MSGHEYGHDTENIHVRSKPDRSDVLMCLLEQKYSWRNLGNFELPVLLTRWYAAQWVVVLMRSESTSSSTSSCNCSCHSLVYLLKFTSTTRHLRLISWFVNCFYKISLSPREVTLLATIFVPKPILFCIPHIGLCFIWKLQECTSFFTKLQFRRQVAGVKYNQVAFVVNIFSYIIT